MHPTEIKIIRKRRNIKEGDPLLRIDDDLFAKQNFMKFNICLKVQNLSSYLVCLCYTACAYCTCHRHNGKLICRCHRQAAQANYVSPWTSCLLCKKIEYKVSTFKSLLLRRCLLINTNDIDINLYERNRKLNKLILCRIVMVKSNESKQV